MSNQNHLQILQARYVISDESFEFGLVLGELKVKTQENNIIYFTDVEFDSRPIFLKTKRSVLNKLSKEEAYDTDEMQALFDKKLNEDSEYESILSKKDDPYYLVYRYLTYLTRSEKEEADKFIIETTGKYLDEITIPLSDIEADMLE